jgi:poly-gamma-glutamate synthesis protein (capsule biosynthesis protein)
MNDDSIKIVITGDLCPVNRTEKLAMEQDFQSIFNNIVDVLKGNDLLVTDLECPLTVSDEARNKIGPHQKAHPSCIKILQHAGVGLVTLANNHIMDYGSTGVTDTLEACRSNSISTVGIGRSPREAAQPYILKKGGKSVAILNYADDEFITSPDGEYRCNPIDSVGAFYDIGNARASNDFVIVIVHGGNEFYELPSPRTRKLYRYLIDLGADTVIAHHTHALSGYEVYRSNPIFYGLGNFIYDWPGKRETAWNRGYLVRLNISDKLDFELIPLKQSNEKPGVFLLDKSESENFEAHLRYLNSIISDDARLDELFSTYVTSVSPMYDAYIEPYFGNVISALRNRGIFPRLMSRRKRMLLLNIIRCESHREVVLGLLERTAGTKKVLVNNKHSR